MGDGSVPNGPSDRRPNPAGPAARPPLPLFRDERPVMPHCLADSLPRVSLGADPRLKLVLVDDHELARAALAKRLRRHDQIVVAGHTSAPLEAHEIVLACAPHVVLVDTVREDSQGANILSSLAVLPIPLRPVLVVHLSYYQPELWDVARAAGADDLILKQIAVDILAAKLLQVALRVLSRDRWPAIASA